MEQDGFVVLGHSVCVPVRLGSLCLSVNMEIDTEEIDILRRQDKHSCIVRKVRRSCATRMSMDSVFCPFLY